MSYYSPVMAEMSCSRWKLITLFLFCLVTAAHKGRTEFDGTRLLCACHQSRFKDLL